MVVMRSVRLKELKNKLSEYLRLAAAGETVLVTDRDRVVAEIGPPKPLYCRTHYGWMPAGKAGLRHRF
jgi:antitoxin (DNA-binding transcriptional repressor) of toxin-antitoxin stability system